MQAKLSTKSVHYLPKRTTSLILRGTLIASLILEILLITHNGVVQSTWLEIRTWDMVTIFVYLLVAEWLLLKHNQQIVNWMLIAFYLLLAFYTLLLWGLNAPIGILAVSFAVILPSVLMGAQSILPVTGISILILISVQLLHDGAIVPPRLEHISLESTFWDVATYSTILSIFALVSWLAVSQREKSLKRALHAESELKLQKHMLADELEKESAALRHAQLDQVRHLHKFALLGQSTAATLHELSNHLSVLNLDIDDLGQQHSNSKAIANTKDSINQINKMVHDARQRLNSYDQRESFNAIKFINRSVKDMNEKFKHSKIKLLKRPMNGRKSFIITGNPSALMQIIAILLNNAFDATRNINHPEVILEMRKAKSRLYISVMDNGPGVDSAAADSLFHLHTSTKDGGLGVGLYIAKHLAKDQFGGNIILSPTEIGARFTVIIPSTSAR